MDCLKLPEMITKLSGYPPQLIDVEIAPKRAGVAILLRCGAQGVELLFIKRAERPEDPWSGHIAFPGGRFDSRYDRNIEDTIRREVAEEIHVSLDGSCRYLGRTDDMRAVGRGRVLPMAISVFVYEALTELQPQLSDEVVSAFWIPMTDLIDEDNITLKTYFFEGDHYELPAIRYDGHVIWGLTLRMLLNFFAILDVPLPGNRFEFPEGWKQIKETLRRK